MTRLLNYTNAIALIGALGALGTVSPAFAEEEEGPRVNWAGTLAVGVKNLDFEEVRSGMTVESVNPADIGGQSMNTQTLDEAIYFVELGIGASFGRFYVAGNVELPVHSPTTNREFVGLGGQFDAEVELDRLDWSVTAGANIWQGLSAFAGYKFGETKQARAGEISGDGRSPVDLQRTYEEKGPFVGISYGIPISDAGLLNFSLAFADLDADNSESGAFGTPSAADFAGSTLLGPETYSGDATGFSYGARWTGDLADSLQYFLSLKYQKYDLDGEGSRTNTTNPNLTGMPAVPVNRIALEIDTNEKIFSFSTGIQYIF